MQVEKVTTFDKEGVLDFCKNTFSWGDYIPEVWDFWINEGGLFVIHKNNLPIAICHASISSQANNVWIEGIRVSPNFRRQGYAKNLILHSEKFGSKKNCKTSQMLIETNNKNSINLSEKLGYTLKDTWNFYSLIPKKISLSHSIKNIVDEKISKFILSSNFSYVDSWRWYTIDKQIIQKLNKENRIIFSEEDNSLHSLAVFIDSIHFEKTMLVTILMGDENRISDILSYIENISNQQKHKRIQILTNLKCLPQYDGLEKKLSFHLVSKDI